PPGEPWPDGKEAISVPLDRLVYPLALRPREPGDVFRPFGMGGQTQKVKDLLINLRLGPLEKERVRILENGDGAIIWVVGYRMDERFRVQAGDDPVVKITIKAD
ncbi:MAG: tRNA lysidine(34) synthetase TilS, partial [Saprospiraceae bacterium]